MRRAFKSPLINKPFKPPSRTNVVKETKSKTDSTENSEVKSETSKSMKKNTPYKPKPISVGTNTSKSRAKFKPPTMIKKPNPEQEKAKEEKNDVDNFEEYWTVMHTKRSNKKHKTYDDGILHIKSRKFILLDTTGKVIMQKIESSTFTNLKEGDGLEIGTRELELVKKIPPEEFISGRIFLQNTKESVTPAYTKSKLPKPKKFKSHENSQDKTKKREKSAQMKKKIVAPPDSYILNEGHAETEHDVYIDPFLARKMREYQKIGVKFMYECVMGLRKYKGQGCLLADDMGLGKTFQTIVLLWTLLTKGPKGVPVAKKAVVVTNSSIVKNWAKEFKKWLGDERCKPVVVGAANAKTKPTEAITNFKNGYHKVMIISYDLCTRYADDLHNCKCDILVCDEGHKLKNKNIKIFQVLNGMPTQKRIILTGTPLQNKLEEYYCVIDFINPRLLGEAATFNNLFAIPIAKSREPNATSKEKEIGLARSTELNNITNQFVLRRTNEMLRAHLPPKLETIVFCYLTELQKDLYLHFTKSKKVYEMLTGNKTSSYSNALACIQTLKKLLTHPDIIHNITENYNEEEFESEADEIWSNAKAIFPDDYKSGDIMNSGKMYVLYKLLDACHKVGDRIVVVSNFTTILDEIEKMCDKYGFTHTRLDGSTSTNKRMEIIDSFNNTTKHFVFLLSAKAGGYGINLIGANRLVLFDPDWNPSVDHQAMSRIWREGQKKNVFIYRFVSTGTIEEKIFQRQIVKTGLSKTVVDEKSLKAAFSQEMLKTLFEFNDECKCETFKDECENDFKMNVKENDELFYNVLEECNDNISFVKIVQDKDDDAYKLTLDEVENEENEEEDDVKALKVDEEVDDEYMLGEEKPNKKKRKREEDGDEMD